MKTKNNKVDRVFFGLVIALVITGIIMFTSASLGILASNETKFYGVIFSQFLLGLGGGIVLLYATLRIPYKFWRQYSLPLFIASIVLTMLVFVPHIGFAHGGARRWISV